MRDRTHANSANIKPRDPVILGLCTQSELNAAVAAAADRAPGAAPAMMPLTDDEAEAEGNY